MYKKMSLCVSFILSTSNHTGFIKQPSPSISIVPSGDEVTYHCQHNETEAHIGWWINGESLGSSGMQGFDPQQTSPSGSGSNLHSLHINTSAIDTTLQVFTIQCTAMRVGTDNVTLVLIYPGICTTGTDPENLKGGWLDTVVKGIATEAGVAYLGGLKFLKFRCSEIDSGAI